MSAITPLTRSQIACRVAHDIPDGSVVNLGIGMPTAVGDHLPAGHEILLHSENGILGMGQADTSAQADYDLINASRQAVTLLPGASICEHTLSFAMMRGGHLDYSILGGFQVAANGDLANWITDAPQAIAAIGGAMDLAVGARHVLVMMEHTTRQGQAKLLAQCSYPLTATQVVTRVYTDLAVIDVTPQGFSVFAWLQGMSREALQQVTGAPLHFPDAARHLVCDAQGQVHYQALSAQR